MILLSMKNCPVCNKETYYVKGVYHKYDHILMRYGECKLCKFSMSKFDAYFISCFDVNYSNNLIKALQTEILSEVILRGIDLYNDLSIERRKPVRKFILKHQNHMISEAIEYLADILMESIWENEGIGSKIVEALEDESISTIEVGSLDEHEFGEFSLPYMNLYSVFGERLKETFGSTFSFADGVQGLNFIYEIEYERMELKTIT